MSKIKYVLIIILLLYGFISCNTTEPPPGDKGSAVLSSEDVSCTEAWLKLSTSGIQLPAAVTLTQDGKTRETVNIAAKDTILYVDSLLPNQTYKFKVSSNENPPKGREVSSNEVNVSTLDTTSSNFTWQTWTWGYPLKAPSSFYDVAYLSDTLIWAVGEVYLQNSYTFDSLGHWIDPYNAIYWNGSEWKLKRIHYYDNGYKTWNPIATMLAFNKNDVWFSPNIHWNGYSYLQPDPTALFGWTSLKMWGTGSDNLYAVGTSGNIATYIDGSWHKITSGTNYSLGDVYGDLDGDVYACGFRDDDFTSVILKNTTDSNWKVFANGRMLDESQLFHPDLYGEIASVYATDKNTLYAGGNILFRCKFGKWDYVHSLPENKINGNPNVYYRGFITKVRGQAPNDLWIIGDRNTLRHFNGVSWKQVGMPYDPNIDLVWTSISIKGNEAVIVGNYNNQAIIMVAKR